MVPSFLGVGQALGHPSPLSALPRAILYARSTKIERFRGKPAISDLGWPFTPSHESSPYFATYVGSVLQGLLELSSTCSWLDRSVSGQIVTTGIFPGWKAPTPNGLSRCSHLLADPLCKRYAAMQRLIVFIGFLDSFSHPITHWISFHTFPSQYLFTIGQITF